MTRPAPPPIWDILEEHLDEASFLWTQWETALASARYTIGDVAAGPEERLRAHLDALALGGAETEEKLLLPALASDDVARAAAAAAVLAAGARLEPVRAAVRPDAPQTARAIARALGLTLRAGAEPVLAGWLRDGEPASQGVALEALSFRGAAPAADVRTLLSASDPALLAAALRASPVLGDAARPSLEWALAAGDLSVRDAAIEAGLRLGLRVAWIACQRAADAGKPTPLALETLGSSGEPADVERIAVAAENPDLRRAALFSAGFTGSASAVDVCMAHLGDAQLGRVAGEALSAITGLAITGAYEITPAEQEEALAFEEDEREGPPGPDPDLGLPVPDPDVARSWWQDARPRFAGAERWLAGKPWTVDEAARAFASGSTRRRHALGRELTARSRGDWRVETRAFARDQLRMQKPLIVRAELALPFGRLLEP